jgi:hypothetical protein
VLLVSLIERTVKSGGNITSTLTMRFTITDRWANYERTPRPAAQNFLLRMDDAISPENRRFVPLRQYYVPRSALLVYDPRLVALLPEVHMSMRWNLEAHRGTTKVNFARLLQQDLLAPCGVSERRIKILALEAGSVQATFTITPPIIPSDLATSEVVERFLAAVQNLNSSLYSGVVTSTTEANSTRVVYYNIEPSGGASAASTNTSLIVGVVVGVVLGVLVLALLGYGYCWFKRYHRRQPAPSSSSASSSPALPKSSRLPPDLSNDHFLSPLEIDEPLTRMYNSEVMSSPSPGLLRFVPAQAKVQLAE